MALLKALHLSQDGSTPDIDRLFMAATTHDGSRVVGVNSFSVSEKSGTPDMSVDIAAGQGWVAGTENTFQGSYFVKSTASENLTIPAADGSNPRKDLVVARVRDSDYSGASDDWLFAVVEGTPAASPTVPTAPANSLVLAIVDVAASETAIENAHITDTRYSVTYNAGGYLTKNNLVVAENANFPSSPETGDRVWSSTDGISMVYSGAEWWPEAGLTVVNADYTATGSSSASSGAWTSVASGISITVPTWASTAYVNATCGGVFNSSTNSALTQSRVIIGGDVGTPMRIYPHWGQTNQRFAVPYNDAITLTGSGSQTVYFQHYLISGTGNLSWDTSVEVAMTIIFRP